MNSSVAISRQLLLGTICLAAALLWNETAVGSTSYQLVETKLISPNTLRATVDTGRKRAELLVMYPSWRVVLVEPGMSWQTGIPYEMVYDGGAFYGDRDYRIGGHIARGGTPVPSRQLEDARAVKRRGGTLFFYGYFAGEVLYALESGVMGIEELADLADAIVDRECNLGLGLLPRVAAKQFTHDSWLDLTRFNIGQFYFLPAPDDTIRLEFRFAALQAAFMRDHVELLPVEGDVNPEIRIGFFRPPGEASPELSPLFEGQVVALGDPLRIEFPWFHIRTWAEFHASLANPEVCRGRRCQIRFSGSPSGYQAMRIEVSFAEPGRTVYFADKRGSEPYQNAFARWPLWPTVEGLKRGERCPVGFPGQGELPEWAVRGDEEIRSRYREAARQVPDLEPKNAPLPSDAQLVDWGNTTPLMVRVEGAVYQQGMQWRAMPPHEVSISRDFAIGRYEVTNAEFCRALNWANQRGCILVESSVVRDAASLKKLVALDGVYGEIAHMNGRFLVRPAEEAQSLPDRRQYTPEDHPVHGVTWYGAAAYCNWLSEMNDLAPLYLARDNWHCRGGDAYAGECFRLPTEGEWELAARGPEGFPFPWGPSTVRLGARNAPVCNYEDMWTRPVGSFSPNGDSQYGAADMIGNVWEWTFDRKGGYTDVPKTDPSGPAEGAYRMIRGGAYDTRTLWMFSSSTRAFFPDEACHTNLGFRIARTLPTQDSLPK